MNSLKRPILEDRVSTHWPMRMYNSNRHVLDTVLAYKQRNKIGRFAEKGHPTEQSLPDVSIPIGARCEVETAEEGFHKRGTVRFVGSTKFGTGEGIWVGIEYDEPIGKNDGS